MKLKLSRYQSCTWTGGYELALAFWGWAWAIPWSHQCYVAHRCSGASCWWWSMPARWQVIHRWTCSGWAYCTASCNSSVCLCSRRRRDGLFRPWLLSRRLRSCRTISWTLLIGSFCSFWLLTQCINRWWLSCWTCVGTLCSLLHGRFRRLITGGWFARLVKSRCVFVGFNLGGCSKWLTVHDVNVRCITVVHFEHSLVEDFVFPISLQRQPAMADNTAAKCH